MRATSQQYKRLRAANDSHYEIQVIMGARIYDNSEIVSALINNPLFEMTGLSIGNSVSKQCDLVLIESSPEWPRMAQFTVRLRLASKDGQQKSEWLSMGTFYTDQRSEDREGKLSITAFDRMLQTEQYWTDKIPSNLLPANWPITARAWATMIQSAGLFTFADLTSLDDSVAFIGLNTASTIRDVLSSIAAAQGGNWQMVTRVTAQAPWASVEELKLIPFANLAEGSTAIAGLAVAGIAIVGRESIDNTDGEIPNLGMEVMSLETSPVFSSITGVRLETESGTVGVAGDDSGYTVKSLCEFSANANRVAALCLSRTQGYSYRPFTAGGCQLDPAAEVGDSILIDGRGYQVMSIDWNLNTWPTAELSAPYDAEVDHEYTVLSPEAKHYRKVMGDVADTYLPTDQFATAIEQNEQAIVLTASHSFYTISQIDAALQEIQRQVDGSIETWSGNAVPTLNNSPASDWTTAAQMATHVGDIYFVNSGAGIPEANNYYRFEESNGSYQWTLLTDSAISEALTQAAAAMAAAQAAQSSADSAAGTAAMKGRIFVKIPPEHPDPPYSVNDLWFRGENYSVLVCTTAKSTGQSWSENDWEKKDNYIDASTLNTYLENSPTIQAIQAQTDKKAETYYQGTDPAIEWLNAEEKKATVPEGKDNSAITAIAGLAIAGVSIVGTDAEFHLTNADWAEHVGDLWYNTENNTTHYFQNNATLNRGEWIAQSIPSDVFDRFDKRATIFIEQPYPPYHVGDLWFQSDTSEIMTCIASRETGSFVSEEWVKRNKYTDDTTALEAYQWASVLQTQVDQKAETFYQDTDPSLEWITSADDLKNTAIAGLGYAGLAVAGRGTAQYINSETRNNRVGDLWYNTTDQRSYYWTVNGWREEEIPQDVFDTIDGKATVFATQPTPPYHERDLWVNATYSGGGKNYVNDILRCTHDRETGEFDISDWELASRYTDNTELNEFKSEFSVEAASIRASVERKVSVEGGENVTNSFSWVLNETGHRWYCNGGTNPVLAITGTGLTVVGNGTFTGEIRATSGYIGNATNGFTISSSAIYNGVAAANSQSPISISNITDTDNRGIYLGTDGIYLGGGKFQVNSQGALTANSGTIGGWTIGTNSLYNSLNTLSGSTEGAYLGTDGLSIYKDDKNSFKVTASTGRLELKSGMTGINDTTNTTGMYIGPSGIALGGGKFAVTSAGAVTASNLSITGGSISIGTYNDNGTTKPVFQVTSSGAVTANSLSITGGSINITREITNSGGTSETITAFGLTSSGVLTINVAGSSSIKFGSDDNKRFEVSSTGEITARAGTIGSGTSVFAIDGRSLRNGMASFYDTSNDGVYVGTDGIALGGGKFTVSSAGAVTASNLSITGGSISIGSNFRVDSSGNLTAKNASFTGTISAAGATFTGKVYAENITQGANGWITSGQLASGVNESLGYANSYNSATGAGTSTYPANFTAGDFYADTYYIKESIGSSSTVSRGIKAHYHKLSCNAATGEVQMGEWTWDSTEATFNIADTQFYQDGVSAETISSGSLAQATAQNYANGYSSGFDFNLETNDSYLYQSGDYKYGLINLKNADDTTKKTLRVIIPASSGKANTISASPKYNIGTFINPVAELYGSGTYTSSGSTYYYVAGKFNIGAGHNNTTDTTEEVTLAVDATSMYTAGQTNAQPQDIVRRINEATGLEMPDTWNSSTNKGQIYLRAVTDNDSIYFDDTIEVDTTSAIYQAGVAAGSGAGTVTVRQNPSNAAQIQILLNGTVKKTLTLYDSEQEDTAGQFRGYSTYYRETVEDEWGNVLATKTSGRSVFRSGVDYGRDH